MSRIGRLPVTVPKGVDVKIDGQTLKLKGPKGELAFTFHENVSVTREDGTLVVARKDDEKAKAQLWRVTQLFDELSRAVESNQSAAAAPLSPEFAAISKALQKK